MKHVMYGLVSILLVVLAIVAWLAVEQRSEREMEMEAALQQAVADTVDQVALQGKYRVRSDEELVADFTALLTERLHVQDEGLVLTVDIAGVDAKKGLLSVHVKEEFTHPNGRKGTCETSATMVLEQEEGKAMYEINYVIPEEVCRAAGGDGAPLPTAYKRYVLEEGGAVLAPQNPPSVGGKKFLSWADENGTTYTRSQIEALTVEQALTFTAIYG